MQSILDKMDALQNGYGCFVLVSRTCFYLIKCLCETGHFVGYSTCNSSHFISYKFCSELAANCLIWLLHQKINVFFSNNVAAIFVQMKIFWKELQQWSHWNLTSRAAKIACARSTTHVKAFMAGNVGSGGKSLFYVILSKPWQPQPIHLQNGRCLEKMLKTLENINSLQNGYLFFG